MHILILGTAAAEGIPGLFCDCRVCTIAREVGGRECRSRTSVMINDDLKIDFPPDTFYHTVRYGLNLRNLRLLLFTHIHEDHFSVPELHYSSNSFVSQPLENPITVAGSAQVITKLSEQLDLGHVPYNLQTMEPFIPYHFGRYTVTPIIAHHAPGLIAYNYIIEESSHKLLYGCDTGWYDERTWCYLEKEQLDGVIAECTKGRIVGGYDGHMGVDEVIRLKSRLENSGAITTGTQVVTVHYSHLGGMTQSELEQELSKQGIAAGYDGLQVTI
ncbi:MAG: MBL fold metallo-hydrolase [Armatimonadetes bacterium]|nr:MBL fold metallo-hydrolase [Armatimonadota bacterium]